MTKEEYRHFKIYEREIIEISEMCRFLIFPKAVAMSMLNA